MRKYTRREFNKAVTAAVAGAAAAGALTASCADGRAVAGEGTNRPPNIVFLLTDDHRYDALGYMGNPVIKTPHLDALAREGVVFNNSFCTSSVCCSSRASILTGTYNRKNGIYTFQQDLNAEMTGISYPARLREAGYRTGFVGKYGIGTNMPEEAFDFWRGFPGQGSYFYDDNGGRIHANDLMLKQSVEFLESCGENEPFCLSVSYKTPHAVDYGERVFPPAPRYESMYAEDEIPLPPTAGEQYYEALPEFLKDTEGRKRWEHNFAPEVFDENMRDYYRLLTHMDETIGLLRAAIAEKGWGDNTIFIYTTDNGYLVGDYGLEGKWYAHEVSIRTPLIVFDPRAKGGRSVDAMALNIDISPTILELAGVEIPGAVDGMSLAPWLRGEESEPREHWFYEHLLPHPRIPKSEGVRTNRWKYIRWIEQDPVSEELYDLEADPLELNNLADERGDVLEELRVIWRKYSQGETAPA